MLQEFSYTPSLVRLWEEDFLYKFPSSSGFFPPRFRFRISSKLALEGATRTSRLPQLMAFLLCFAPQSSFFPKGFLPSRGQKYLTLSGFSSHPLALLMVLRLVVLPAILRRDLAYRSFLFKSSWIFVFRDLGELGLKKLPYDFFGWSQPVQLFFESSQKDKTFPMELFLSSFKIFFR